MATLSRSSCKLLKLQYSPVLTRNLSNAKVIKNYKNVLTTCACVFGGGLAFYALKTHGKANTVYALKAKPDELAKSVKLTSRERRFIKFASVEYGGQLYMTPQDFLESVVEQEPRPRLKRRVLTTKEIEYLRDHTPQLKKGSSQMFRKLKHEGIISYTEYLFLLSILTKPASGFQIAFNMFDTDGNQRVDKNEFLVLLSLVSSSVQRSKKVQSETTLRSSTVSSKLSALSISVFPPMVFLVNHRVISYLLLVLINISVGVIFLIVQFCIISSM